MSERAAAVPGIPYRGIRPFRYIDHAIFFARGEETRHLASLVSVYRGVLLYGDSGSGKSSLVNAGLIPEAIRLGFAPERLRVQPRACEELVVERIRSADDDEEEMLPSVLTAGGESQERTVLAVDAFEERVRAACERHRPLLIFDQFEEIVTLFDEARAHDIQQRLVEVFVRLLRGSLPAKVVFSFREDYLGKVKELLSACPELVDQALRIAPPASGALPAIIRGPFERYPDHFARQLSPALAGRLVTVLAERFGAGDVSLSEVQTVCLRLWESDDPEALLTEKGPQGLLEDYLGEALGGMPAQLRPAAIVLLAQMVTSAGTRNVISAGDLFQRVQEQEGDIAPGLLEQALEGLSQSRLVRRERRRDLDLYEITSEFLVPWISHRRDEYRRLQDRRRDRRRLLVLGSIAMALLLVGTVIGVFAANAVQERNRADHQRNMAVSAQVAAESEALDSQEPLPASLLAVAAWRIAGTADARVSLLDVLAQPDHGVPLVGRPPAHAVAFSPDGRTLATAGAFYTPKAGSARLWSVATRKLKGALLKPDPGEITAVAFSPTNGRILATAGLDGSARLWDTGTDHQIQWLRSGHLTRLTAVAFGPGGKVLATAGADGTARLWDLATGRPVGTLRASRIGAVNAVAFSPGGKVLATAGADGTARLWDLATHSQIGTPLAVGIGGMNAVAFSPDGKTLATAGADGTARLWDITVYRPMGTPLSVGAGAKDSVAFSPGGKTVAAAGADGMVRLWDLATGRPARTPLAAGAGAVNVVAFSPDGRTLAVAGADGMVRLWDLATGRLAGAPLAAGAGAVNVVAFSPDGTTLATAGADGIVRLWNVGTHRKIGQSPPNNLGLKSVVFSPDGKIVATVGNNKIMLWAGGRRRLQQIGTPLASGNEAMNAVAFSPDGRTIATASGDGTARLWDRETHQQVGPALTVGGGGVADVAFSPDGKVLATVSRDGVAQRWNIALPQDKDLARAACAISGRSLMPREWASFIKSVPFRQVCPGPG
ncbi:MAG TPA: WD40 repeat domain-containing protein [Streptosporangiaceae bacterium]|nr:WD40 repeat domain-containing protein [Streptosporangiaceae bacterium]